MTNDEMLRQATECRVLAEAVKHRGAQNLFVDLAETWERLALRRSLSEIAPGSQPTANDNIPEHFGVIGE
jgi:hypothetical protein